MQESGAIILSMPNTKKSLTLGDIFSTISKLRLKDIKITQLLYILLLVAALIIGYLFARIQTLEKNAKGTGSEQAQTAPAKNVTADDVKTWAKELGLNMNTFNSCFDSSSHQSQIDADSKDGTTAGVSGTPSFYVNGVQIVGAQPYSAFKTEIDNALAGKQTGAKVTVTTGRLPRLGQESAPVTIVEFADFECPFCKAYFNDTFAQIKKDYIDTGKVKYYYRHFPLSFHPLAQPFANAAECANDQGKFWEMHDKIFKEQS